MGDVATRAKTLRDLHKKGDALPVPNAWDAASARTLASVGFRTIATTSAGVSWAHGAADGERLAREDAIRAAREIADAVGVPVSVDAEGGYLSPTDTIEETVSGLIEAGAAGVNLEDGSFDGRPQSLVTPEQHAETINRARAAADSAGVELFINGRTDVFWRQVGEEPNRVEEAVRRLRLYAEAGADCAFVPGLTDGGDISVIVEALDLPLNVLRLPGLPPFESLRDLGVARVTFGADFHLATIAMLEQIASALREDDLSALEAQGAPSRDLIALLLQGESAG